MKQTYSYKEKVYQFLLLFLPIFLTQTSLIGTNVLSTIFSGHASTIDLAGIAIGSNLWIPIYTGMLGVFLGITPIISQYIGANKTNAVGPAIWQGIYIAIFSGLMIILAGYILVEPLLSFMKLDPAVSHIASTYLTIISAAIVPVFILTTLRNVIDAHGYTPISMMVLFFHFCLVFLLFYTFVFGHFGFPRLGGLGTGYALVIADWITCTVFFVILCTKKPFSSYQLWRHIPKPSWPICLDQLKVGIPIGISIFCEVSIFSLVTLLMSEFGTQVIAAHQSAISFATLTYIVPVSLAMTSTILISYEIGANRVHDVCQYTRLTFTITAILACSVALFSWTHLELLTTFLSSDPLLRPLLSQFIVYSLFYILADAFGTPTQGILRGYKDVTIISFGAFICYWVISLPLGYYFAHYTDLAPFGYWAALSIGLTIAGIVYNSRLYYTQRKYRQEHKNAPLP